MENPTGLDDSLCLPVSSRIFHFLVSLLEGKPNLLAIFTNISDHHEPPNISQNSQGLLRKTVRVCVKSSPCSCLRQCGRKTKRNRQLHHMYLIYISLLPPSLDSRFQNQLSTTHLPSITKKQKDAIHWVWPLSQDASAQDSNLNLSSWERGKTPKPCTYCLDVPGRYFNTLNPTDPFFGGLTFNSMD